MTIKTQGGIITDIVNLKTHLPPAAETTGSNTVGYVSIDKLTTEGYPLLNYRKRLRLGELLPYTPFRQYSVEGLYTQRSYNVQTSTYAANGSKRDRWVPLAPGSAGFLDLPETLLSDKLSDQGENLQYLVQQAAAKIYTKNRFDALTFLAELHKTIAMFAGVISKLINILNARSPGTPWNLWLEGRYGWRILLFDLKSLDAALQNLDGERIRHSERASLFYTLKENSQYDTSTADIKSTWYTDDTWEFSLRGTVAADASIPTFRFNPLTSAWELLKFSFVVDWLLNVGQALESLSFLMAASNYTAAEGFQVRLTRYNTMSYTILTNVIVNSYTRASNVQAVLGKRTPCSIAKLPQVRLRINDFKILDLMALLLQTLGRR